MGGGDRVPPRHATDGLSVVVPSRGAEGPVREAGRDGPRFTALAPALPAHLRRRDGPTQVSPLEADGDGEWTERTGWVWGSQGRDLGISVSLDSRFCLEVPRRVLTWDLESP